MALPVGLATVTVTTAVPLTLPSGEFVQGYLLFTAPDIVTVQPLDFAFGGTARADLVDGAFSIDLPPGDADGMDPAPWPYRVEAVFANAPGWRRWIELTSDAPSVNLTDVLIPNPTAAQYVVARGARGNSVLSDATDPRPPDSTDGISGDWWIDGSDPTALVIYGPKTAGGWGDGQPIGGGGGSPAGALLAANNLDDLQSAAAARGHLGLGGAAVFAVGTTAGTVAAGDDARFGATQPWVFDVKTHGGAVGDGRIVGAVTVTTGSTTVTSSGRFVPEDHGRHVIIVGAGPASVTSHVSSVASVTNSGSLELADPVATSGTGLAMWIASDDSAAINQCLADGAAYAVAHHGHFEMFLPPGLYGHAGPLLIDGSTFGNSQTPCPATDPAAAPMTFKIRGPGGGANTQHWLNTDGAPAPAAILSFGLFQSKNDQGNSVDHGNPCVLGGPAQAHGYGQVVGGVVKTSGARPTLEGFQVLLPHSTHGWTYSGIDLSGMPTAVLRDIGVASVGSVQRGDFGNPSDLLDGYSYGILMPANGNNDLLILDNVTVQGFSRGIGVTEHTWGSRVAILYCGEGLELIGNYYGSSGAQHGVRIESLSLEGCHTHIFVRGSGSAGIGPFLDVPQLSTETSQPLFDGTDLEACLNARGEIRWTGELTAEGLVLAQGGCGISMVNVQNGEQMRTVSAAYTLTAFDRGLVVDSSAAAVTITLPSADRNPTPYMVKRQGANEVTLEAATTETVEGGANFVLDTDGKAVNLKSVSGRWVIVG